MHGVRDKCASPKHIRRPIDCTNAGEILNTSAILSRHYTGPRDQLKSVAELQFGMRVCSDADLLSDDCDPDNDVVRDNATAFCIVFIAQILAICFGKVVMHFKLRLLVDQTNRARRMANLDPRMAKRAKRYMDAAESQRQKQKKVSLVKNARFKRAVTVVRFTGRLADGASKNETVEGFIVEVAEAVATHWVKHRFFFTMVSLAAMQVTYLIAGLQVGAQSA